MIGMPGPEGSLGGRLVQGQQPLAGDHDASVINMSFRSTDDEPLHEAIRKAQAADVVLVASVGN